MFIIYQEEVAPIEDFDIKNYRRSDKEIIDSLGGNTILWNSGAELIKYTASIVDPDNQYPGLSDYLIQEIANDPEFMQKVIDLYTPTDIPDPNDPTAPANGNNKQQSALDWFNNEFLQKAGDFVTNSAGAAIDDALKQSIKSAFEEAAGPSIKAAFEKAAKFSEAVNKAGLGAIKTGLEVFGGVIAIAQGIIKSAESGFDPVITFGQYVTGVLTAVALVYAAPVVGPLGLGVIGTAAALTAIGSAVSWASELAGNVLGGLIDIGTRFITEQGAIAYEYGKQLLADGYEAAIEGAKIAGQTIADIFNQAVAEGSATLDAIADLIDEKIAQGKELAQAVSEAVTEIVNDVVNTVNDVINTVIAAGEKGAEIAKEIADSVAQAAKDFMDKVAEKAIDIYEKAIAAGQTVAEAYEQLKQAIQDGAVELGKQAGDLYDDVASTVADYGEKAKAALDDALAAIGDFLSSAGQFLWDGVQALGDWLGDLWDAFIDAINTGSPLVLDLDGDGIELVSLENTSVYWDIDEDGFAEATGWVAADDGLLAIDTNGDGIITDHTELFGSTTQDGFTVLTQYDSNSDGVINASDTAFAQLLVWQDINQNGASEEGELVSLSDLNITEISLSATTPYNKFIEGNNISHESTFTIDDGVNPVETREIVDAWFEYDNTNTKFVGDFVFDINAFLTPNIRGYGNIADMQISASMDNDLSDPNSLLSRLVDFSTKDMLDLFVDDYSVMDQARDIAFRWGGTDIVTPGSRGKWVDAQEVGFLEALLGEPYLQYGVGSNPGSLGGQSVNRAFETALYPIAGKLIAQAAGSELFNAETVYNPITDSFDGFTSFNQVTLDALLAKSLDGNIVQDKTTFWTGVINVIDSSVGVANLDAASHAALEAMLIASDDSLTIAQLQDRIQWNIDQLQTWNPKGDFIYGTTGDDTYGGNIGDDHFSGGYGDDLILGGLGDDLLYGGPGNDTLSGQLGNDDIRGNHGDDTYLFSKGHGDDIIYEQSGNDKIIFGEGITVNDLTLIREGAYNLRLQLDPNVGYGSITINGHFSGGVIETLEFNDLSTLDLNSVDYTYIGDETDEVIYGVKTDLGGTGVDIMYGYGGDDILWGNGVNGYSFTAKNELYGGTGNDSLYADRAGDFLDGGTGNDKLTGNTGIDTITGGAGNDTLIGNNGDDIFIFNSGDGDDILSDTGGNEQIFFGTGITLDDISFIRQGAYDLKIALDPSVGSGSITVTGHFSGGVMELLKFEDGTTLDLDTVDYTYIGDETNEIIYGVKPGLGGAGADTLYGYGGDDVIYGYGVGGSALSPKNELYGGAGNDKLYADKGGDFLDGGTGNDLLAGGVGVDTLIGGTGDDTVNGSRGNDEYHFNYGDGDDIYQELADTDTIIFGAGITADMLNIYRANVNDLMIEVDGGLGGSLTLNYQTYGTGYIFENVQFDDGSTLDLTSLDLELQGTASAETLYGVRFGGSGLDTIYGNGGNDVIYGYRGVADYITNYLYGGDGNDIIYGSNGIDYIEGNSGDDKLFGNLGVDTLIGGTGNDTIQGSRGNDIYEFNYGDGDDVYQELADTDTIKFGAGITADMLDIYRSNTNDVVIDIDGGLGGSITINYQTYGLGYVFETVQFDDGSTLDLTSVDLELQGTESAEALYGVRYGGSGLDTIYGNGGNDAIYGYRGYVDTVSNFLYGGDGNDKVYGAHGTDYIEGNSGSDTIYGYNGNDIIEGGIGHDNLRGGNQDDILNGGDGNDTLLGENHNDTLNGGLGDDILTGGGGYDTFVFDSLNSGNDTISDFNSAYDLLQFESAIFATATDVVSAFSDSIIDLGAGGSISFTGITGLVEDNILIV